MDGSAERMSRHTSMPLPSGQPGVEDRDVGLGREHARQGLLDGAGLADDLETGHGTEQFGDAAAHDLVVVEQEDAHRCRVLRS